VKGLYWGNSVVRPAPEGVTGEFVRRDGEDYYRIANFDGMPPFYMTVVSGFDHWMFVSSTGGLTCGRRSPENALFPYYTDDKIHDSHATTGPQTLLRVARNGREYLWKPFAPDVCVYDVERNLYKSRLGNRLVFEEVNRDLELVFSYGWSTGDRFGFIRRADLRSTGPAAVRIEVLDGLRNLLPCGVSRALQGTMSTLVDAYKQAEAHPRMGAALYTLSSLPSDRAEPSEALAATVAWTVGLDAPKLLLVEDQVAAFCAGAAVRADEFSRGRRGAFFVQSSIELGPHAARSWYLVADVEQGPVQVPALFAALRRGVSPGEIERDTAGGSETLLRLTGSADGCQHSNDGLTTARHFSNSLFNIMRGGVFYDGYAFPVADFLEFAGSWNRALLPRVAAALSDAGERLTLAEIAAAARASGDPDFERLVLEYLPLTFSRRHGDPSRPWNQFSIDTRNADGSDRLHYQGNWRDIFQNWEALAISYPEYIESFVAKFVNASTADGYNAYRISRDGFEWEVLDPADPWSNIGYWGDHQVNYLLRLIELSLRYHPGRITRLMGRDVFVYADVPYRLKGYADLLRDPRTSVAYDAGHAAAVAERVAQVGSDGRLMASADGSIYRVNLLEKLLVPVLVKIGNLVPCGGIWMNTQRPEWNDANNALVGYGLSMVTLCYLRRYLVLLAGLLREVDEPGFQVSPAVRDFVRSCAGVLVRHREMLTGTVDGRRRKSFMDEMGAAGEAYRAAVYAGFAGGKVDLDVAALLDFVRLAVEYLDHSIRESRREDGLYHAYRLVHFEPDGYEVENLAEMLEGQVAALSSGCLGPEECLALLDALKASALYCPRRRSYLLYPDRKLPLFLDKNVIPARHLRNGWMRAELDSGQGRYLVSDLEGKAHFHPRFSNVSVLREALDGDPEVSAANVDALCALYETVFRHRQFTGRSGSMYKYEGLGCIYWHMVSKLALAAAEVTAGARRANADDALVNRLYERFDEIRNGLGIHDSPAHYGAIPVDPYSHTPGFAGAQQPGMTGQVKEDIIARFAELGVRVSHGRLAFEPVLLRGCEFPSEPAEWNYSVGGDTGRMALEAGSLAFTLCGVPVIYRLDEDFSVRLFTGDGAAETVEGTTLGREWSRSLFRREGRIRKIEVRLPRSSLR